MGERNYLIEGVSGTGKTSVCDELQRRGYHAVHGDRELAYQGDPETGEPTRTSDHEHHIWNIEKLRELAASQLHAATFFCGGARNRDRFIDLFDAVFVLEIGLDTLRHRLAGRPVDEFGGRSSERDLILRLHATGEACPKNAITIDAEPSVPCVVDDILSRCGVHGPIDRRKAS